MTRTLVSWRATEALGAEELVWKAAAEVARRAAQASFIILRWWIEQSRSREEEWIREHLAEGVVPLAGVDVS